MKLAFSDEVEDQEKKTPSQTMTILSFAIKGSTKGILNDYC